MLPNSQSKLNASTKCILYTELSSQGELSYDGHEVRVFDFLTQRSTKHTAHNNAPRFFGMSGHGGADYHLMDAFVSAVAVSAYKYFYFSP